MGFLLLFSGFAIVLVALLLLAGVGQRLGFVLAGLAVELIGLGVFAFAYRTHQTARPKGIGR